MKGEHGPRAQAGGGSHSLKTADGEWSGSLTDRPYPSMALIPSLYCCRGKPAGVGLEEEVKWRKWVDDRFVKVLTANIYRSWE